MSNKVISVDTAVSMIKDNSRVMIGGFLACGTPDALIDGLLKKGTKNLHVICICTDFPERGLGPLVVSKQITSLQTSHIGTNKTTQDRFNAGELKIEFCPQGSLMERIRAAGAGLGGVLTPVGLNTTVADGKPIIEVEGKRYILETPIQADFAIVRAEKADKYGNLVYNKLGRNSNPAMCMAGKVVIAEVDEIVEPGEILSEHVVTPSIYVNYIVKR